LPLTGAARIVILARCFPARCVPATQGNSGPRTVDAG
jgi:hypothetical protein